MSTTTSPTVHNRVKPPVRRKTRKTPAPMLSASASIEELRDARISRAAIRLLSVGLVAFLIWANFAPVTEIATGTGEIAPIGLVQNIQHLEGGIVAEVYVRDGQDVTRGQPILRMDELSARAELSKAMSRAEGIRLEIARRASNATGPASVLEGSLQLRGIANSQQAAARADEAFQQAQMDVVRAQMEARQADLTALTQREAKVEEELAILTRQLADFDRALKTGAISRRERDNVARDKIQLEGALLDMSGQRAAGQAALLQAEAQLQELRTGFRQTAEAAIADLEIEAANAQELVTQLQDRLNRTTVVAPESGRILKLAANNPGQVIAPGEQIAQIIPKGQSAVADVEVPADQIGFISVGMDANVRVLTFDYTRFGSIPAKVASISANSIKDDPNRAPYFLVRLALERITVDQSTQDRPVLPGMSVVADIKLGEKSVMSFLLKPLRSLSDRAMTQQ